MIKIIIYFNVLLLSAWAMFQPQERPELETAEIPMCAPIQAAVSGAPFFPAYTSAPTMYSAFETDSAKTYSMPLLSQTPQGEALLSWTERDDQGVTSFCMALSTDGGKTFSDKKTIYAGTGVGNSRLFRAKVLAKKDGGLVAVFSNRPATQAGAQGGRGGRRSSELVFCASKDRGNTWTSPQAVDPDPTPGLLRGFFDAVVLPNDEIAVAYLKDVQGSTKHEERDLRLVLTKNGAFQPEQLLDPVVCDCCNISLLVDAAGALHVYYRDNNDDIRDIARMTSVDNGRSFSKPQIVYGDGWKIMGCPHNGAASAAHGKSALVAWFSGAETEPGIRLSTQEGEKLLVLSDPAAKNHALAAAPKGAAALLWEQGAEKSQIAFRKIEGAKVSETFTVEGSDAAANPAALVLGKQLLVAHEVKRANKKNGLKIAMVAF